MQKMQLPGTNWKNRTGLLVFVLIVGIGGLFWLALTPQEPSHKGKPLRFWLSRATEAGAVFSDQKDPNVIECREAIRSIGTNAIPMLLRILRAKDSTFKRAAMDLVER